MKTSVLANRQRAHLDVLKAKYPNTTIYEDYVRLEQRIENSKTTYNFDPRQLALAANTTILRPNQKGVNTNDLFIVTQIGLFIDSRVIAEQSRAELQTWPSPEAFAAATISIDDLFVFYNGQYSLKVGNYMFIPGDTTNKFLLIPDAQQNNAITQDGTYKSGWKNEDVFYPNEPLAVLSGKADTQLTLNINTFTGIDVASTVNTQETVVTWFLKGFTVYNGADNFQDVAQQLGWAK